MRGSTYLRAHFALHADRHLRQKEPSTRSALIGSNIRSPHGSPRILARCAWTLVDHRRRSSPTSSPLLTSAFATDASRAGSKSTCGSTALSARRKQIRIDRDPLVRRRRRCAPRHEETSKDTSSSSTSPSRRTDADAARSPEMPQQGLLLAAKATAILIDHPDLDASTRAAISIAEAAPALAVAVATSADGWNAWHNLPGRDRARAIIRVVLMLDETNRTVGHVERQRPEAQKAQQSASYSRRWKPILWAAVSSNYNHFEARRPLGSPCARDRYRLRSTARGCRD